MAWWKSKMGCPLWVCTKKLSSSLFALRKLSVLPQFLLRTIYYSIFDCHINYGLLLWGGTYTYLVKPLCIQQKKALRILCKKPYNFPSNELFKNQKILNLTRLYELHLGKFIFRINTKNIPKCMETIVISNNQVHSYNTRNSQCPHMFHKKTNHYCMSFLYKSCKLWLELPLCIRESFSTNQFVKRLKNYLLNQYD